MPHTVEKCLPSAAENSVKDGEKIERLHCSQSKRKGGRRAKGGSLVGSIIKNLKLLRCRKKWSITSRKEHPARPLMAKGKGRKQKYWRRNHKWEDRNSGGGPRRGKEKR